MAPPNISPSSDESFEHIDGWLKNCLNTHSACAKPDSDFMPTRLVEIGSRNGRRTLKLVDMVGTPVQPYTALSYCWGGYQDVQTTKRTLPWHMVRINFTDLPPTLQHAVVVTEKLGLKYLWVDALSIIQDDEGDKALEIENMSYVYSHATVTILASRAPRVKDGFLNDRMPLGHEKLDSVFRLPFISSTRGDGSVILVHKISKPVEPLSRRAWAFQERLLAPRILDYGSMQTWWICQTAHRVDGMLERVDHDNIVWNAKSQAISARNSSRSLTRFEQWTLVIEQCTSRELTLAEDRLPAIAGIAERMQASPEDQYVAGLWKSTLPGSLLWFRSDSVKNPCPPGLGPSWSWASVNCAVTCFGNRYGEIEVARILDVGVIPKDFKGRFGAVKSGHITVEGPMLRGTIENEIRTKITDDYLASAAKSISVMTKLDRGLDLLGQDRSIHLLHIQRSDDNKFSTGLFLKRQEDKKYLRVGWFRMFANTPDPGLFASIPIATVTII